MSRIWGFVILFAVAWAGPLQAGADATDDYLACPGPDQSRYFALAVRAPEEPAAPRAVDAAIFLDTSADRTPRAWQNSVQLARDLIDRLQGGSRVRLATTVEPGRALVDRPAAVGSDALNEALHRLGRTAPIGTSNLEELLDVTERWLDDRSGSLPKVVLLVGDVETLKPMPASLPKRVSDRMVESRATLHWVLMDRSPSNPVLASLAARTGGRLYMPAAEVEAQTNAVLAGLAVPVLYDAKVKLAGRPLLQLPKQLPPLRSDVSTLIAGEAATESNAYTLTGVYDGRRIEKRIPLPQPDDQGNGFLVELVDRWAEQPDMPSLYPADVAIAAARITSALQTEQVLAQAKAALSRREIDKAQELYRWVSEVEPNNSEAQLGLGALRNLDQQPAPPAPEASPKPTESDERSLIKQAQDLQRIEAQRLHREVSEAIRQAKRASRTTYEDAIRLLKQTMATVESSLILSEDQKVGLVRRIEQQLRILWRERQRAEAEQLERDRVQAQIASRQRTDQDRYFRELTTKELMQRYQALLEAGDYAGAQATAYQMTESNPDSVAAHAAEWKADLAASFAVNEAFERRRAAGYIGAIRLSQASAVPMPDEPPIVYPPAKVWEDLTIRRQKYKVVDLAPVSPAEEQVRSALSRPVSFDFQETPLSDVIDFLRDYTGVNVVLDQNGLDEVQIDADTPVTLRLEQVTLKSALNLLLKQFELTYMIKDEVLLITSERFAAEEMVTKVYPVADLVIPIIDFNSGGVGLNGALGGGNAGQGGLGGGGFGGFGGGGGGAFGGAGGGGNQAANGLGGGFGGAGGGGGGGNLTGGGNQATGEDIAEELIELIKRVIEPESWDSAGGPGSIREFNKNLVVRAKEKTHQKVAGAAKALRGQGGGSASATPPTAEEWDSFFANHTVSDRTLRRVLAAFADAGSHKQATMLIEAALRHQPVGDWVYEPLALSMQIAGAPASQFEQALLSRVQRNPNRLDVRLSVAESLASLGSVKSALNLLKESAALFPMSANLYFMVLDLSEPILDVDAMAWSANQLLKREWPKQSDEVHQQTRRRVDSLIALLEKQGQLRDAARLKAVTEEVQRRDLEVTAQWAGEADVDLYVVEPGDLFCGPAVPQTVNGGILVSDGLGNDERYVCAEAFSGDYDLIVRPVWGQPAGGLVTLDVVLHKGTPEERRMRHTVRLQDNAPVTITLTDGRRTEQTAVALQEPFLFADRFHEKQGGRTPPMVQLRQLIDAGQIRQPKEPERPPIVIGPTPAPLGQLVVAAQRPFVTGGTAVASGGAVAFDPTITLVNDGVTLAAQAVVSADRRYVRMQLVPVFQQITGVSTQQVVGTAGF